MKTIETSGLIGPNAEEMRKTVGILDDAKETIGAAAEKVSRSVEDTVDRLKDKVDEVKADADVKKAEAEAESVKKRNEVKEDLRDS